MSPTIHKEKIEVYLPSVQDTEEQKKMTEKCRESLVTKENVLNIIENSEKYPRKVAQAWNWFFDQWRNKVYSYLMIVANDTIADPNAIDYMLRALKENPNAGLITGRVIRDIEEFEKSKGSFEYNSKLTKGLLDPACFIINKGVIEKVGRVDEEFPVEFVERDFIYRLKLAGYDSIQLDTPLWYHPPYSGTVGNDQERLQVAYRKYLAKWGGDANAERYMYPYNDMNLTYTFCRK